MKLSIIHIHCPVAKQLVFTGGPALSVVVAQQVGCRTSDQQVAGLTPVRGRLHNDSDSLVPMSPSGIIWSQSVGSDSLQLGCNCTSDIALTMHHRQVI